MKDKVKSFLFNENKANDFSYMSDVYKELGLWLEPMQMPWLNPFYMYDSAPVIDERLIERTKRYER